MRIHESVWVVGSGDAGFGLTHPADCTVYLLDGGREWALVDTGSGMDTGLIAEKILALGTPLEAVRKIFLTHGHGDHAGGAKELSAMCGAEVFAMEQTAKFVSEGDLKALSLDAAIDSGVYEQGFLFRPCKVTPLKDGDRVQVGDMEVEALLMEGHCKGHGCFQVDLGGKKALFSGDSVFFGGKISLQAIWDCELGDYVNTLRRLEDVRPEALFPSHGAFSLNRGYLHCQKAMDAIRALGIPKNMIGE